MPVSSLEIVDLNGRQDQMCIRDRDKPIVGSSFLAIKTEAFCEQGEFRRNVDALIDEIKNVKLEAGTDEVLMPGEIEFRAEKMCIRDRASVTSSGLESIMDMESAIMPHIPDGKNLRSKRLSYWTLPLQSSTACL